MSNVDRKQEGELSFQRKGKGGCPLTMDTFSHRSHRARPGSAHSQRSRRQKDALGFSRQRPTTAGVPRPKTSNLDRSALNTRTALSNAAARVSYGRSDKGGVNTTASTRPQTAAGTLDVMGRIKSIISAPGWDGRGHPHFYKFGKIVGQGSFGTVRMVGHLLSNMTVAIKSYDKSKIKDKAHLKRIQQEVRLMERLNHPYVIRLFETIESTKRVHLVMELASGGNLCSYVKSRKRLSEREGKCRSFEKDLREMDERRGLRQREERKRTKGESSYPLNPIPKQTFLIKSASH